MDHLSLEEIIDKRFVLISILSLVILILILSFGAGFLYFKFFEREERDVYNDISYYFRDLESTLGHLEQTYNQMAEKELKNYYRFYQKECNVNIDKFMSDLNSYFSTYPGLGPEIDIKRINYYLIDKNGIIIRTDYEPDKGLDFSKFTGLWERLKKLPPGEVLLMPLDRESSTGRLKLYSYLKLPDNMVFEIGISFKDLDHLIKNNMQKLLSDKNIRVNIYTHNFASVFNTKSKLSTGEIELLKKSQQEKTTYKRDSGFFKMSYYRGWPSNYGSKYIKIEVDYTLYKLALIVIVLLIVLVITYQLIMRHNIVKLINKISEPVIELSRKMQSFNIKEKNNIEMGKSGIKEIEHIKESYSEMVKDINASYEQLEAYNEEVLAKNDELYRLNHELDTSRDKLKNSRERLKKLSNNLEKMIMLTSSLVEAGKDDREFLSNLLNTAVEILPEADYGSVYTYDDGKVNFVDCIGYDLGTLQRLNLPADSFYNQKETIEVVSELKKNNKESMDEENFIALDKALKPIKEIINCDLTVDGEKMAGISVDIAASSEKSFSDNSVRIFGAFHNIATSFFELQKYYELQGKFVKEIVLSITRMLEIHDPYTGGHSENVADTASYIAEEMGLTRKEIKLTYWAGMVHDIGKILIPEKILNKKGPLTEKEYKIIKKHPRWGYKTLISSQGLKEIAEYVLYHHEYWNGEGYPEGLKGEEIPLISRILSVADAWDAMTSDRAYRKAFARKKAREELVKNINIQFDERVVKTFLKIEE